MKNAWRRTLWCGVHGRPASRGGHISRGVVAFAVVVTRFVPVSRSSRACRLSVRISLPACYIDRDVKQKQGHRPVPILLGAAETERGDGVRSNSLLGRVRRSNPQSFAIPVMAAARCWTRCARRRIPSRGQV